MSNEFNNSFFAEKHNAEVTHYAQSIAFGIDENTDFGFELGYKETIFGRLGVYNFQQGLKDGDTSNFKKVWIYQPSAGVGFKIKNVEIDYAFTNLANQSNPLYTHIFSLKLNLIKKENR